MASQKRSKTAPIIFIVLAVIAIASSVYLTYNQLNGRSEAGQGSLAIFGHRPDPIIDSETTSALILGQNFQPQCSAHLGDTDLRTTFMNTESLEVQLPSSLPTDILEVRCPSGSETFRLNVQTTLEELP